MAIIMMDMDGTLVDFLAGYRALEMRLGKPVTQGETWDDYWDPHVWQVIKQSDSFWLNLDPMKPDMDDFMKWYHGGKYDHDTYFVTARPGKLVKWQTEEWLRIHGVKNPTVILSNDKGTVARGIKATCAIEDKPDNAIIIAAMAPKCHTYLIDRPYNQMDHRNVGRRVKRVKGVREFLNGAVEGVV